MSLCWLIIYWLTFCWSPSAGQYAECHSTKCCGTTEIRAYADGRVSEFNQKFDVQHTMEQCILKHVNNYLNTNIYPYLETSGNQHYNIYLNVVHFFSPSVNKTSMAAKDCCFPALVSNTCCSIASKCSRVKKLKHFSN